MGRVISLRVKDEEAPKLELLARQFSRSVGETASLLLREKLREEEFPFIEFRSSSLGRHAYMKSHRLAVWEVVYLARGFDMDPARLAEYLKWPEDKVRSALAYAEAYPGEIDPMVSRAEWLTFEDLKRTIPWIKEAKV